jgi:hypothetical protein
MNVSAYFWLNSKVLWYKKDIKNNFYKLTFDQLNFYMQISAKTVSEKCLLGSILWNHCGRNLQFTKKIFIIFCTKWFNLAPLTWSADELAPTSVLVGTPEEGPAAVAADAAVVRVMRLCIRVTRGQWFDLFFCQFLPIFCEKMAIFLSPIPSRFNYSTGLAKLADVAFLFNARSITLILIISAGCTGTPLKPLQP